MIEIVLYNLGKSDFYQKSLETFEQICSDYSLEQYFGIFTSANQVLVDFLSSSDFNLNLKFQLDNNSFSLFYEATDFSFENLSIENDENTYIKVLNLLSDEISFSSDYSTLTLTFHVKTKLNNSVSLNRKLSKTEESKIYRYK